MDFRDFPVLIFDFVPHHNPWFVASTGLWNSVKFAWQCVFYFWVLFVLFIKLAKLTDDMMTKFTIRIEVTLGRHFDFRRQKSSLQFVLRSRVSWHWQCDQWSKCWQVKSYFSESTNPKFTDDLTINLTHSAFFRLNSFVFLELLWVLFQLRIVPLWLLKTTNFSLLLSLRCFSSTGPI